HRKHRPTHKNFVALVAVEKDELADKVAAKRASNTEMLATRGLVAVSTAGEEVTGHCASLGRQAVPEPQFDAVVFAERHTRAHTPTGEMHGAVDLRAGEI